MTSEEFAPENAPGAQAPGTPDEPQRGADQEAAATDFRQNSWLLVVIFGVIVLAWILSVASGQAVKTAPAPAPEGRSEREEGVLKPPAGASEARRSLPGPARRAAQVPTPEVPMPMQVMGSDRLVIPAAPPLMLQPVGIVYRRPRAFDVTRHVHDMDFELLSRLSPIEQRYAGQYPHLVASGEERDMFVVASSVDLLRPDDRLVVVSRGTVTRAYPVRLLRQASYVSDVVGGAPVFVCWHFNTQIARCFISHSEGTSAVTWIDAGLSYRGSNLFYDEETTSLWDGATGRALTGPRSGEQLPVVPVRIVVWDRWAAENPDSAVLMPEGAESVLRPPQAEDGSAEPIDPLDAYLRTNRLPYKPSGVLEFPPKEYVLGVRVGAKARAYPLRQLVELSEGTLKDTVADRTLRIIATSPRTARAEAAGDGIEQDVMLWFAWKGLHPETDIFRPKPGAPR